MPTSRRPQKRCSSSPGLARPHPLVAPGDPPRRRPARPAAHPACPHHRLVMLATRPPSECTTFASEATNATVALAVWLRDVLGPLDHEHRPGEGARIEPRAVAGIGEAPVLRQALADDLLRRAPVQHPLAAGVAGLVEALEQSLEVAVAGDGDAEHLPLHATVEALDHPVGARGGFYAKCDRCGVRLGRAGRGRQVLPEDLARRAVAEAAPPGVV